MGDGHWQGWSAVPRGSRPYGRTTTFEPIVANVHIAFPSARRMRTPPVFFSGSGLVISPFVAALKPIATSSTLANRTTCSIGTPSEPGTCPEREVTVYEPGAGLTVDGMTANVRVTLFFPLTSQTRRSLREYTTRGPAPESGGSAWGFSGFCSGTFAEGAALGVRDVPSESGALACA